MTTPAHPPAVRDFVRLAHRLLAVIRADAPDAACALDALVHTYVALVRAHPRLGHAAQRSLLSAARALVDAGRATTANTTPH